MTLPSFLIIGAMKAGSTSLFRWLGTHPDVALPQEKEPNFFSDERRYRRGRGWYEALFPDEGITGEASVGYTDPFVSAKAAARAAELLPDAKLIFLHRDPIERMRSHYRHEVQRGREKRTFAQALAEGGDPYVRLSSYADGLAPWRTLAGERLLVLSFEELVGEDEGAWLKVLRHLGLSAIPRPTVRHNVTSAKQPYKPLMRWIYDMGLARFEKRVPRWAKTMARPLLLGRSAGHDRLLASCSDPIPHELETRLRAKALL